jgi:hypothetical protein
MHLYILFRLIYVGPKKIIFSDNNQYWRPSKKYYILIFLCCKGLGLCVSPMTSKVQIPLDANNSLGPARRRRHSITQSVWRGFFTRVWGLSERGGYIKWLYFGGVSRHQKKIALIIVYYILIFWLELFVLNWILSLAHIMLLLWFITLMVSLFGAFLVPEIEYDFLLVWLSALIIACISFPRF